MEETAAGLLRFAGKIIEDHYLGDPIARRSRAQSTADSAIETYLRASILKKYPDACIIGEEFASESSIESNVVWVIDPLDGTDNLLQGFPLCAASIGILCDGEPLVGAIWCSCSHMLKPGVYHCRQGTSLKFDGSPVIQYFTPPLARRLGVATSLSSEVTSAWAVRRTGSAALESALVAAGVFEVVRFGRPKLWDIAAGVALGLAVGLDVRSKEQDGWRPLSQLPTSKRSVLSWTREIVIGQRHAVDRMCISD